MLKSIFIKEWIKTRWYLLVAMLVLWGFAFYLMLNLQRIIEIKGAVHIWEVAIQRDSTFVDMLKYIPLLIGIVLGVVQYVPEMHRKCLKLTLHLPFPASQMILSMLSFGVMSLITVFVPSLLTVCYVLSNLFATEIVSHIMFHIVPWFLAGIMSYLFTTWITLEPTWKRRIVNIVAAVFVLRVFLLESAPEAYNAFLPILVLYIVLSASLTLLSVSRFKEGLQD